MGTVNEPATERSPSLGRDDGGLRGRRRRRHRRPPRLARDHRRVAPRRARRWPPRREAREEDLDARLCGGATRARGAGRRARDEEPDEYRTCFERDRDRILHSSAFRRLAGKTQVFIFPEDHMRTRLTHALEVAQVATGVARAVGLNVALTEAIALGHDCGHGPGGHASEEALDPFVEGGFDHAAWGAEVSLAGSTCAPRPSTASRNHSWSRPAPRDPRGRGGQLGRPHRLRLSRLRGRRGGGHRGRRRPARRRARALRRGARPAARRLHHRHDPHRSRRPASSAWTRDHAEALGAFRAFNYRPSTCASRRVSRPPGVVGMLRALVEYFAAHPMRHPRRGRARGRLGARRRWATPSAYVAGMTDRFACRSAVALLDWPIDRLPNGIDR